MTRIYLDHAATSPLLPEARDAMLPWLDCGNPSSLYSEGRVAKQTIDRTREILSDRLGCRFAEVLFTSGGTEAANLAIVGAALANDDPRRTRILLGASEHHCVLDTASLLRRIGYRVDLIPVDRQARIIVDEMPLADDVLLVSAMHANNELGTYNDLPAIRTRTRGVGALLHVDAVQSFCVGDWTVDTLGADLVTVSAHKIGGPKGIGAIYLRAGTKIKPLVVGGGQEREVRGGTENVAGIAGFGAAIKAVRPSQQSPLRDQLEFLLLSHGAVPSVTDAQRLPGHCHVRFGVDAETILIRLDRAGISASSGSACSSGSVEPSHVLIACGYSESESREGIRLTLGRSVTAEEVEEAARRIGETVAAIRAQRL